MSRRSRFALGAQTTRLTRGMLLAGLRDHLLDVERLTEPRVKLPNADIEFGAQLGERVEALENFAPKLLLRGLRQLCCLGDRQFECPNHGEHCSRSDDGCTVKRSRPVQNHP